jgi:Protein of unknown function (DUF3563)
VENGRLAAHGGFSFFFLESYMSMSNKFSNIKNWCKRNLTGTGIALPDTEQAYLAAASDHLDLERRMRVLDCRHGSILHTLRVLKVSSY